MSRDLVAVSRFLSYVLRHHPEEIGITLDDAGWVDIHTLLAALAAHGRSVDRTTLDAVVAGTDKVRLEVVDNRIRAAQGHSVRVDLGLQPATPPPVLFHGTVERFVHSILVEGLRPGARTHVHLSVDRPTAMAVGGRRGTPVILTVDAAGLHASGQPFYRAANGVWLTGPVAPEWLRR